MIYPKPKNEEEEKRYNRLHYERKKEAVIRWHKLRNLPEENLNEYIVNSLIETYEEELREDGLI